jgi:CDP-6-deoxy-D-xylo-4-hexulose-3-dehydrase
MITLVKSTFYREAEVRQRLAEFVLRSDKLSMGAECESFERAFAAKQERRHCIMVNSGSSANLAVVQALLNLNRIARGALVGFSALTWSTNVMPLIQLGLRPVPIDVELDTLNVSSRGLLAALERAPLQMLFLTDLLGWCDDVDAVRDVCAARGIVLIEDACEALGSVYRGTRLGNFGVAGTFSFTLTPVLHHRGRCDLHRRRRAGGHASIVRAHGWDRTWTHVTDRSPEVSGRLHLLLALHVLRLRLQPSAHRDRRSSGMPA